MEYIKLKIRGVEYIKYISIKKNFLQQYVYKYQTSPLNNCFHYFTCVRSKLVNFFKVKLVRHVQVSPTHQIIQAILKFLTRRGMIRKN